jgi:hypothetical protein
MEESEKIARGHERNEPAMAKKFDFALTTNRHPSPNPGVFP